MWSRRRLQDTVSLPIQPFLFNSDDFSNDKIDVCSLSFSFSPPGGSIKRALFCRNDKFIVSAAEDKTLRLWDRSIGQEVQRVEFNAHPNSIELSADNNILTVTHGTSVSFWETETLKKLKEITLPSNVATASLHPDKHVFVCGGEDFKMYKYDYITGNEIGWCSAHLNHPHFMFLTHSLRILFVFKSHLKDILDRCMRSASVPTANCMPVAPKTAPCASGKPLWAKHMACGSAQSQPKRIHH